MDISAKSKIPKIPIKTSIPKSPKSPGNSGIPKSNFSSTQPREPSAGVRSRSKPNKKSNSTMSDRKSGERYSQEYRPSYGFEPQPKPQDRRRSSSQSRDVYANRTDAHDVKSNFSRVFRNEAQTLPNFEEDFGPTGNTVVREVEHGAPREDISALFPRPNTVPASQLTSIPPPNWERRHSEKERRDSNDSRRPSLGSKTGSYGFTSQDLDDILAKYKGKPSMQSENEYQVYQASVKPNYENRDPDFTQDFRGGHCRERDKSRNAHDSDYHNNGNDPKYQIKKKSDDREDVYNLNLLDTALGHQDVEDRRYSNKINQEMNRNSRKTSATHSFPFKETPNGELIIYPEQIAFESKALSVLVADPSKISRVKAGKVHNQDHVLRQVEDAIQKSLSHLYDNHGRRSDLENDHRHRRKTEDDFLDKEIVFMQYSAATEGTDKLMTDLHQRLRSAKHADTHVVIGDKVYPCHSLALEVYSNYFDTLNRPRDSIRRVELPESEVPAYTFPIVMDWIMQNEEGRLPITSKENVVSLFSAANFLQIPELKTQCINFLNEKLETNDTSLMQLWDEVKKRPNCQELMSVISSKAAVSFQQIYKERQFLNLDIDEIVMLLSSDDIVIDSELDVYDAATRWLLKDWKGRQVYTNTIMGTVRFALLSPLQLTQIAHSPDLNHDTSLKEYTEILNNGNVKTMMDQGLAYSILDESYQSQPEEFEKWMESTGIKAPRPRNYLNPLSRTKKFSYLNYKDDATQRHHRGNDLPLDRRPSYTVIQDRKSDLASPASRKRSTRSVLDMFNDKSPPLSETEKPRSRPGSASQPQTPPSPGNNSERNRGRHLEEAADMAGKPIPEQDIENLTRSRSRSRSKDTSDKR